MPAKNRKNFEASQKTTSVIVRAGDAATKISIRDRDWNERALGIGRICCELTPGNYSAYFETGGRANTFSFEITLKKEREIIQLDKIPYFTSVPLTHTKLFSSEHLEAAFRLSHSDSKAESEIFVFICELVSKKLNCAWNGLRVCNLNGNTIVDLSYDGERNNESRYAGCLVAVKPGRYRLQVQTKFEGMYEMIVVACQGWQTQVFLTDKKYGARRKSSYHADLNSASILMAPLGEGFNPEDEDARLTDLARIGLLHHRNVIQPEMFRWRMEEEGIPPMLGLYGLWGMLLPGKEDSEVLQFLHEELEEQIGDHPDVQLLKLHVQEELEEQIGDHPDVQLLKLHPQLKKCDGTLSMEDGQFPPMLWNTWRMIVKATADEPFLVSVDSLSNQAANGSWGDGPWLVWREFPQLSKTTPLVPEKDAVSDLVSALIISVKEKNETELGKKHLQLLEPTLLPLEQLVLNFFRPFLSSDPIQGLTLKELVTEVGVPAATLLQVIGDLTEKIKNFDIADYLGKELKRWATRLKNDVRRRAKFRQLIQEAVELFPKDQSNVDRLLIDIANQHKWPVWAVECLRELFFIESDENAPESYQILVWYCLMKFVPKRYKRQFMGQMCNGGIEIFIVPKDTFQVIRFLNLLVNKDRLQNPFPTTRSMLDIINHILWNDLFRIRHLRDTDFSESSSNVSEEIKKRRVQVLWERKILHEIKDTKDLEDYFDQISLRKFQESYEDIINESVVKNIPIWELGSTGLIQNNSVL